MSAGALFSASAGSALLAATGARQRESDLPRAERTGIALPRSPREKEKRKKEPVGK